MADTTLRVTFEGVDKTLGSVASGLTAPFKRLGDAVTNSAKIATAGFVTIGAGVVGVGAKLISLGSDAEEMQGKFNVVFANTGQQVTDSLATFANQVGRSRFELMEMASTFGDTLKPMGFTEDAAADMSVQLSQLATDLGSFNNMSMDEALQRLQGTLIGNHENALAFGVIINENTLSQELARMGADDLTGAMLEQAKVQARINLLMAGTTDAQGDALRTSGSWANQMRRLKSTVTDFGTELGLKLLPIFTPLLEKLGTLADEWLPKITDAFENNVIPAIGDMQTKLSDLWFELFGKDVTIDTIAEAWDNFKIAIENFIAPITEWVTSFVTWNDVLTAFGLILGGIVLSSILSVAIALAPIVLAVAGLIAGVALVRTAWEENWGGIQEKTAIVVDWFKSEMLPWFETNIPLALEKVSNYWEETLKPAMEGVWNWMSETLMPFIKDTLIPWFQEKIPLAIDAVTETWEKIRTKMTEVWNFLTVDMMPIWTSLVDLFDAGLTLALTALAGIWENVLLPALKNVKDYLSDKLNPVLTWLKDNIVAPLNGSFDGLGKTITTVAGYISDMAQNLRDITLPDWMTPGSPTPWEIGLKGVSGAMQNVTRRDLPQLNTQLQGLQSTVQNNTTINQNTTVYTSSYDVNRENNMNLQFAMGGI